MLRTVPRAHSRPAVAARPALTSVIQLSPGSTAAMPEPSPSYEPLPNTPSDNQPPPARTPSRLRTIGRALLFGATAAIVVLAITRANQWTNYLGELQAPPGQDIDAGIEVPAQGSDNKNTTSPDMPERGKYSVG